jgi:hypothetical protein
VICFTAFAQPATAPRATTRLRGVLEQVDANSMKMKERSGEEITLALAPNFAIVEVLPIDLSSIKPGSFVGVAAMPQPDGTQQALEVLVFPEAMRGTGEGHYPWDLQPGSTMTNATVAEVAAAPQAQTLRLRYKDGEKTMLVPAGVPVVTLQPAPDRSLLVPGANMVVTSELRDGKPTALRALVGRSGFKPPM